MGLSRRACCAALGFVLLSSLVLAEDVKEYISGKKWPEPKIVDPGAIGGPPADAIVLFDGKDMSKFEGGGSDQWLVADGVVTVHGGGDVFTKQKFGDCQLHVEWAEPTEITGKGQHRGNSGIFLQSKYELQVLDSYHNKTYFDGQCGAIYKQSPPLVNVCRKPGEWQAYDVIFTAPRFKDGKLESPAYITVLQNGVLVQNHFALEGETFWEKPPSYQPHDLKLPISIQDHGYPIRFRNIWVREL